MAIANCPECLTKLKVPDGTTASVRCPKCKMVFKPNAPAQPAFEVVDEAPARKPAKPAAPKSTAPAPAKPAPNPAADFEVVDDAPAKKKVVAKSDLDDDDRPRKRRRDDDDDDDDRPRRKRRDDDDEDDRPRSKKRGRDDDDFDFKPNPGKKDGFAPWKLGAMFLSFSFWTDVGMYGLLSLFVLIM